MEKRCKILLALIGILTLGAVTLIAVDSLAWQRTRSDRMRTFHRAVGGLGLGAIAAPMWQFMNYDFRVQSVDDSVTWPVPGGYSYGPDRTANVTYFEEVASNQWIVRKP